MFSSVEITADDNNCILAPITSDIPSDVTTTVAPFGGNHTHTVIFIHGREDFGEDLARSFFDSKSSTGNKSLGDLFPSIKWVFPTSKLRYSAQRDHEFSNSSFAEALKGEEIISQWFDLWDINTPEEKEELMVPGLRESIQQIEDIIEEEAKIIPLKKIILGGISQGGATAIYTLLSTGLALGGLIDLCSWLPFQHVLTQTATASQNRLDISKCIQDVLKLPKDKQQDKSSAFENFGDELVRWAIMARTPLAVTPVFIGHSRDDATVPFGHGEGLYRNIQVMGFEVIWKGYDDGGHWIHPVHGVDDIANFLNFVWEI